MTDTIKRLAGPVKPSKLNAGTALYTPTAGVRAAVKNCLVTNTSPFYPGWLWLGVGAVDTTANRLVSGLVVPPGKTIRIPLDVVLTNAAGDALYARQSMQSDTTEVVQANMSSSSTTVDATSVATGAWSSASGGVYYLVVWNTKAASVDTVTSVTDTHTGVTWTQIHTIADASGLVRITAFRAQASGVTNTTTTANFSGTMTGAGIAVIGWTGPGVDATGTNGDAMLFSRGTTEKAATATPAYLSDEPAGGGLVVASATVPTATATSTTMSGWSEQIDLTLATPAWSSWLNYSNLIPASWFGPTLTGSVATIASLVEPIGLGKLVVAVNGVEVT